MMNHYIDVNVYLSERRVMSITVVSNATMQLTRIYWALDSVQA